MCIFLSNFLSHIYHDLSLFCHGPLRFRLGFVNSGKINLYFTTTSFLHSTSKMIFYIIPRQLENTQQTHLRNKHYKNVESYAHTKNTKRTPVTSS